MGAIRHMMGDMMGAIKVMGAIIGTSWVPRSPLLGRCEIVISGTF